ncbi:MAG: hypothetical protein HQM09_04340 [Candidatus Riflebacteria bacterium]|nr:hypothetical protein [Candidatus Riflebacteria bacterium]
MNKLRTLVLAAVCTSLITGFSPSVSFGETQADVSEYVHTIGNQTLRNFIENSVNAGVIKTPDEAKAAVARWQEENARNSISPNLSYNSAPSQNSGNQSSTANEITQLVNPIANLDQDAIKNVVMNDKGNKLFNPISDKFPPAYDANFNLAVKFNPIDGTDDSARLDADIAAYLNSIANDPVIQYALKTTGTTISDLKRNWFGSGCGFEHVFDGEVKGPEVSGYHSWYKFYRDENEGRTQYVSTLQGAGDSHIFTGSFSWDPDGSGPLPRVIKKKGGFTVGNSPQAVLAMGHIAMETCRKHGGIPGALIFSANINGESFNWQLYTMNQSIRSLYPMSPRDPNPTDINGNTAREYFELEEGPARQLNPKGSLTVH